MLVPFTFVRRVQFAETDMAGIVHFANFFRMMEECEHAFFRSVGLSVHMAHDGRQISWPRVAVGCEFFGPARFEDELSLQFRITRLGGKSLHYEVDFELAGKRIALGKTSAVCCVIDETGMRSISIPPELRAKLSGT